MMVSPGGTLMSSLGHIADCCQRRMAARPSFGGMTFRLPRRLLAASVGVLAGLAAIVLQATPAHADFVPGHTAYMWAYRPTTSSYTIPITSTWEGKNYYYYAANDGNGAITVTRSGTGTYLVRYGGLGALLTSGGGIVHATAYGSTANFCTVGYWYPSGGDLLVSVDCFDPSGARADTMFVTNFQDDTPTTADSGSTYLWADQPTASSYAPSSWYRWDASGGTPWIYRDGVGTYRVYMPSSAGEHQTTFYQTTAYTGSAVICKVAAYLGSGVVRVQCRNTHGSLVDSRFTISYSIYDLLQRIAPTELITVSDTYPSGGTATKVWTNGSSASADYSVTRITTGVYQVFFPQIANPLSHAVAYATGYQDARCHVISWYQSGTSDMLVNVTCANSAGTAVNTPFVAGITW